MEAPTCDELRRVIEIVPLISGAETGPLGIVHLPRLWLKILLHEAGRLPIDYRHGEGGTDGALLDTLGISPKSVTDFIGHAKPNYPEFERWVNGHAYDLSPETIEKFNRERLSFDMPDPRRTEWCERFGITDPTFTKAIELNQLDDWSCFYDGLGTGHESIVPAISTSVVGPLGLMHLPRLWAKTLSFGYGRLPEGYRHGVGGFDMILLASIGLDHDAYHAFVVDEKPEYLPFEAWVKENAKTLNAETIAAFNDRMLKAAMPPAGVETVHERLAIMDPAFTNGIKLNDLDDWHGLHAQITATPHA